MLSQKRYQIFVSSTYEDLKIERQQVAQAILELEHFPAGMEIFPASNEAQWELIKKFIAESDYFIVIIGGRYGSVDSAGLSYTEKEFDYALELDIPTLGFVRKNIETIPANKVDKDKRASSRLQNFRRKIQTKLCRTWDSPEELGLVVSKSILYATTTQPRVGWVRADLAKSVEEYEKINEIRNRVDSLEKGNLQLREEKYELEQLVRNSVLPETELAPELLAQGDDEYELTCFFTGKQKKRKTRRLKYSWNRIFQAIGPSMFGYLRARHQYTKTYDFEADLEEMIRPDIIEEAENRKIEIPSADVETIILQFKQLGYILLQTNDKDFTGWTLTPKGESQLTRLKTVRRAKSK
jgi:hypothetical protein